MKQSEMLALLQPDIEKINLAMRSDLDSVNDPMLAELIEYSIFSGGKRIRPLLVLLSSRLCGNEDEDIYQLAISLEYLHSATLLHDDVIDNSDQRRGRSTANIKWGKPAAILAGDFLHSKSMSLVGMLGGKQCLDIICRAAAAMVEGEFLQMHSVSNPGLTEKDYFRVINRKTAFLIAAACEIGAVFSQADSAQRQSLRSYGLNLGLAFQVVDDLLDYLGDPSRTGKDVGNDFIEGKVTLPLIHALASADDADRILVSDLLTNSSDKRRNEVDRVRSLIDKHHGFDYARQKAKSLIDLAVVDLENFNSAQNSQDFSILTGLTQYVLSREK